MTHNALLIDPGLTILMAVAGLALGLVYFASLRRSVTMFVGGKSWLGPVALTLGRMGAAVALLYLAAKLGAASLFAALIGFLMARALALRTETSTG
jgi:F1F0 ATPase subunit 2